jgi:exopolysaccharide production protein ExoY
MFNFRFGNNTTTKTENGQTSRTIAGQPLYFLNLASRLPAQFVTASAASWNRVVAGPISLFKTRCSGEPYPSSSPIGGVLKRCVDIFISSTMLVLLSPVTIMVSLIIYFTMGRPILFKHERVGFMGKRFHCYKFRTMLPDPKVRLEIYLKSNPAALAEWRATQKLRCDPRVTPFGRLLRKSSLDELPQLINTLRGEMSCVGPRPVTPDELKRYGSSVRHYMRARPGLSGLWQISGRSNTSYQYRVLLDRAYVTSWSIWLDVHILIRTAPAVFRIHDST